MSQVLKDIVARKAALLATDATLPDYPLAQLNAKAAKALKSGDAITSVAVYTILFDRASRFNLTHPELYICHSNCSAACLQLNLFENAMIHAEKCARLAENSLRRNAKGSETFIKSFLRKGRALLGLGRHREAVATIERGLQLDPLNIDLKLALEEANQRVLQDLAEGKGHERRAIEYPEPSQRIAYHPYAAPLH